MSNTRAKFPGQREKTAEKMRQAAQRYRQVYEKYFDSISTKCTSIKDLYRLLAVLGLSPTAAQIKVSDKRK